ncbi:hypothetical protein NM688_g895 [Phlebia brevispora]|uniref:Uncharacterized protein n=1 Tax=Phlebia brevispora TaxID=194682 RepID=A0ACC1TDE2_9APHY|nr:hypothetical protein NM688_g895 [Phlebia brevispora]
MERCSTHSTNIALRLEAESLAGLIQLRARCPIGIRFGLFDAADLHRIVRLAARTTDTDHVLPAGCDMFTNEMAHRATTMSLSILVTVEMFNAMNSLSENESLLKLPVWRNPFLVAAIALSMALHFAILYIPFFTTLFAITPLNWIEWKAVLYFSFPVILIDEVLKFITATFVAPASRVKVE